MPPHPCRNGSSLRRCDATCGSRGDMVLDSCVARRFAIEWRYGTLGTSSGVASSRNDAPSLSISLPAHRFSLCFRYFPRRYGPLTRTHTKCQGFRKVIYRQWFVARKQLDSGCTYGKCVVSWHGESAICGASYDRRAYDRALARSAGGSSWYPLLKRMRIQGKSVTPSARQTLLNIQARLPSGWGYWTNST